MTDESECKTGVNRPGPLLVWYGQERLATIVSKAGVWRHPAGMVGNSPDQGGEVHNMFDENPRTFWCNAPRYENLPKIIKIEFKVTFVFIPSRVVFCISIYKCSFSNRLTL